MLPNMDEKTGIHYGVINANSLDPETLDQIITRGTSAYEADFNAWALELRDELDRLCEGAKRFVPLAVAQEIREDMRKAEADIETAFHESADVNDDDSPISFDIEGVVGEYLRNSNVVMIFKSPVYTCARQCSPCYPNAGDLDTLDEYGFDTYAPPEDWWYEYNEKTAESVKTLKCVNQK